MKKVDICLTPLNFSIIDPQNTIAVVVDVIRASASICTALAYGAKSVIPLTSIEVAMSLKNETTLTAGERDSFKVDGFDFGNSPIDFQSSKLIGMDIAFTSTNGTVAIECAKGSTEIVIGSFLNFDVLLNWLLSKPEDVVIICAGWKETLTFDDLVFAGKLAEALIENKYDAMSEAVGLGTLTYRTAKDDIFGFLMHNSQRLRSKKEMLEKDIKYCLQSNLLNIIPLMVNDRLFIA